MPARRLILALLALLLIPAAPARADHDHGRWGDAGVPEAEWVDGAWEEDEELPEEDVLPPEDIDPSVVLPARPWTPPAQSPQPARPSVPSIPVPKGRTIKGRRAYMRADGRAAIPRRAPRRVKVAIAAANRIVGKPYKWGGGHGSLVDSGYDCSGTVGYSLVHAGLMGGVMVSGQMARWGSGGNGRWITVYANNGHVYMEVAGLRLDTSPVGDPSGRRGVRWRPAIGRRSGFAARHPAGL